MSVRLFIGVFMLCVDTGTPAFAQEVKRLKLSSSKITNSYTIDCGRVPASDTTQISVDVVNDTDEVDHFDGLILNSDYVDAKFNDGPLLPGQTRRLTIALKPQKQLRRGKGAAHVSFKRPGAGKSNLRLTLTYAVADHFSFDSPFASLQYDRKTGPTKFTLPVFVDPAFDHDLLEVGCNNKRVKAAFGDFDGSGFGQIQLDVPPNFSECFAVISMRHPSTGIQAECKVLIRPTQHLKLAPARLLFKTSEDGSLAASLTVIRIVGDENATAPLETGSSQSKPIVEWTLEGRTRFGEVLDVSKSLCRVSIKIPVATREKLKLLSTRESNPEAKTRKIHVSVRWGEYSVKEDLPFKIFEESI
ncbi:hypothetical protein [Rhodopirellula halodulae]|uniref:hypothetical protein n=1 Tax=Rhodopirellula halodulae TaxID=2894198 RepID=UPI001E5F4928|nr:hypothetical protein [Rhodopirellula sp. JC737]MCC9656567.1 hypothetical protein [Rhodopirellula sp. JC737]